MTPPRRALTLAPLVILALTACSPHGQSGAGASSPSGDRSVPASSPAPSIPTPAASPSTTSAPATGQVNRSSPDATGEAFITTAWTMDTRTDTGPAAAAVRCAALATPKLAAKLTTGVPTASTSDWATWAAHHAHTKVQLAPDNDTRPEDTPTTAYRAWTVTVTPQAPRWTGRPWRLTVFVTMTQTAGSWAVSDLKVS